MKNKIMLLLLIPYLTLIIGCDSSPKVIQGVSTSENDKNPTGVFSNHDKTASTNSSLTNAINNDMHSVIIKDILPTSKYVYLQVEEKETLFWIATIKQDVELGKRYFYKGGLLKTNFESKEHNRVFDKIYLVSSIVAEQHGNENNPRITKLSNPDTSKKLKKNIPEIVNVKGSVKISEILANPSQFKDKIVQVSGRCVKLNPNIMGRNWIHLKDGSKDDYDFVITTNMQVLEGEIITIRGKVILDKDFGAGYRYDLIIENGVLVR